MFLKKTVNFLFLFKQTTIVVSLVLFCVNLANAASQNKIAYFATLKSDEVNVRTGPNIRYPIKWLFKKDGWPVEVVATFEGWRKIRDIDNAEGWVHESLLSRRRNVVIESSEIKPIINTPNKDDEVNFMVENGVIATLNRCKMNWCKIEADGMEGWIESKYLWGVYENEVVE